MWYYTAREDGSVEKYFMAAMGGANGLGAKSIKQLVEFFGSAKNAWFAEDADLYDVNLRNKKGIGIFIDFRREHPNAPEKLIAYCERHKISLCSVNDDDYPPRLKAITDPPMFFYYRGKLEPRAERIGIVGTRDNTQYGRDVALELSEELAATGLTVVSGAARGIDTFAHEGALKSGRTVAVLGCGIQAVPKHKLKFFERIIERGVVLSEFPPQLPANEGTFIVRNRIIAGLSKGVIVVEAGDQSGALNTVKYAVHYNRDVFIIPGSIYSEKSVGCHKLIQEGATLVKNYRDILEDLNIVAPKREPAKFESKPPVQHVKSESKPTTPPAQKKSVKLSENAAKVLEVIPLKNFITADEILMQLDDIAPNELPAIMIELEINRCVEVDADRYKRTF